MADIEIYKGKYTGLEVDELLTYVDQKRTSEISITSEERTKWNNYETKIKNLENSVNCIGEIKAILCSDLYIMEGYKPCDGSELSKTQYVQFWENYLGNGVIANAKLKCCSYSDYQTELTKYGQCAKIGVDSTNGKFKLPLIKDGSFIQHTNDNNKVGTSVEPGLPNITGTTKCAYGENNTTANSGALSTTIYTGGAANGRQDGGNGGDGEPIQSSILNFNASNSSSIYGHSNTVQPQSVKLRYFIAISKTANPGTEIDWSKWATDLDGKANKDLSNVNFTSNLKQNITQWGMPDYTKVSSRSNNITYSETSNGWLEVTVSNTNTKSTFVLNMVYAHNFYQEYSGTDYPHINNGFIPIPKGWTYSFGGDNITVRFIPCIGG